MSENLQQGIIADSIPLFAGHPAHELLPTAALRRITAAAWDAPDALRMLNYGDEQGDPRLRAFLLERLRRNEALVIDSSNLMIVGGSTWGVEMITRQLTQAGDVILVDAPAYRDALHIFRDHRLEMQAIPIDAGGIIIAELAERLARLQAAGRAPKFYYAVPNFHNPTGITLSLARREAIVELSRRYGFVIVEDDVYRDIRFSDAIPPSFYALAGGRDVLRLGSFSKTLAPGLRIGWLLGAAEWIQCFVDSGWLRMGGGANPFTAKIVADYCHSGDWEAHVAWLRGQYRQRRDVALAALRQLMPAGVRWTQPAGGYFIWLTLPLLASVAVLARRAEAERVYFAPGTDFFVRHIDGAQHLRLSYSFLSPAELQRGIAILAQLIAALIAD